MNGESAAVRLLALEARALLTRLSRLRPLALSESMVPAAALARTAQAAIDVYLARGRAELRRQVSDYLEWLGGAEGRSAPAPVAQQRFTLLRLRFNSVLSQFDIFADVLTQRSETSTGVWLAGLDAVSADALALPGGYYDAPPVVCYLDRGPGAAIRRARTRLPGGGDNPVGIVMVPRERMVGSGIASSLVHEVGHQAAALLDLVNSVRPLLRDAGGPTTLWAFWDRWISEILADLWAVGKIGIGAALGLMAVVSLPRAFVFAIRTDDPHPPPWIRVKLTCAIGEQFYPHPQWGKTAALWESLYPLRGLGKAKLATLAALEETIPTLAGLLASHRPEALRGASLKEVLATGDRRPEALSELFARRRAKPGELRRAPPSVALAAIAQAKADDQVSPEQEGRLLSALLADWALRRSLSATCA